MQTLVSAQVTAVELVTTNHLSRCNSWCAVSTATTRTSSLAEITVRGGDEVQFCIWKELKLSVGILTTAEVVS